MDSNMRTAARGLFVIFCGTALYSICGIIPTIGELLSAVGGLISIYGVYLASKTHRNYKSAFYSAIMIIAVNLINYMVDGAFFSSVMDIVISILSLSMTYFICMATAELLRGVSSTLILWANRIWLAYLFCTVISVVGLVVSIIAPTIAGILLAASALISVASAVAYLLFLYRAHVALKNA